MKKAEDDLGTVTAHILGGDFKKTARKRNQHAAFRSVPREKAIDQFLKSKAEVPPVGAYRSRYVHVDP